MEMVESVGTLNMRALVSSLSTASGLWWEVVDTLHRPFPGGRRSKLFKRNLSRP